MKIKLHEIPVRDVVNGYIDSAENGVVGYGGKLNIRPAFQREFIYKDKQRDEVVRTIRKDFPLNVMYWVKSDNGGLNCWTASSAQSAFANMCRAIFPLTTWPFIT